MSTEENKVDPFAKDRGKDADSTAVAIGRSVRRHRRMRALLSRQGIANLDPKTPEGRIVHDLLTEFEMIADKLVPAPVRAACAESVVEALLLKRTFMEHFMAARSVSTDADENGRARRDAMRLALAGLAKCNEILLKNFRMLGIGSVGLDEGRPTLKRVIEEIQAEVAATNTALPQED